MVEKRKGIQGMKKCSNRSWEPSLVLLQLSFTTSWHKAICEPTLKF